MRCRIIASLLMLVFVVLAHAEVHASYTAERKKATRIARLYDLRTGNAKLLMRATLFTDDFRIAFAEKHAEIHYMGPVEAEKYYAEQESLQAREWEVFISMYTRKDYRKFSTRDDSFWKVYLTTTNGDSIAPTSIRKLKKTPYWKEMFPKADQWSELYILTLHQIRLLSNALRDST